MAPGRKSLRTIGTAFVAAPPAGARIRTRLHTSEHESAALAEIGNFLGALYREDYAHRAAQGKLFPKEQACSRYERKRGLTGKTSSRWAGSMTRASEDQYCLAMMAARQEVKDLTAAITAIEKRLVLPVRVATTVQKIASGTKTGYRDGQEHFQKTRRLAGLRNRLADAMARVEAGLPRVVHGSGRLWRTRENLDAAGLTEGQWRARWDAARMFLTADGESGATGGNQTIKVLPDGIVQVKVPAALADRYGSFLRFEEPVRFNHRAQEWLDRVQARHAVRYDLCYDAERGRWYLDASWKAPEAAVPAVAALRAHRTLAVDLNADHLAAHVLDGSGNPVGSPFTVPLALDGNQARRDGLLREAVTRLLDLAGAYGCRSVTVEDLNFDDVRATGRETMGRGQRGKRFRRTVAGIPTAKFRDRLVSMAFSRGMWVIAVDPAYTSKWGGQHWLTPLKHKTPLATRHHAASVASADGARDTPSGAGPTDPARDSGRGRAFR